MNLDELASDLHAAWGKYKAMFGEEPHGTLRQLRAMVEFLPKGECHENADSAVERNGASGSDQI